MMARRLAARFVAVLARLLPRDQRPWAEAIIAEIHAVLTTREAATLALSGGVGLLRILMSHAVEQPLGLPRFRDHLRIGVRSLLRAPLLVSSIVATLGVCIGSSAAVFSTVYAVVLRALPYKDADRLVWIESVRRDRPDAPFSLPEVMDFIDRARTVRLAAYANWSASLNTPTVARRLQGMRITATGLAMLGARPSAGRSLQDADDRVDAARVVMLGYAFWRREFDSSATIINRQIRLNGDAYTVVGVLPRYLPLSLRDIDVVVPLVPDADPRRHARGSTNFLRLVGRLDDRATPSSAEQELTRITSELRASYPVEYASKISVRVKPLQDALVGDHQRILFALLGATALMLAIALANILNLLLIRAISRQGEVAVRRALGASAPQIVSQLAAEGALLAGAGAALGLALARWAVALIASWGLTVPRLDEVRLSGTTVMFVAGVSVLATILFAAIPVAAVLRSESYATLRAAGRSGGGTRLQSRLRGGLVVAELALALTLTAATAAAIQSFAQLRRVELGFQPDSLFAARLALPPQKYATVRDIARFYDRLEARLSSEPGVVSAGVVSVAPFSGLLASIPFAIASRPPASQRDRSQANYRAISAGYFPTIRARLIAGRWFAEGDDAGAPPVAIVSRALVERFMRGLDPLGQQLLVDDNNVGPRPVTVVGVVDDFRHIALDGAPTHDIYIPLEQIHRDGIAFVTNNFFWTIRVAGDPDRFGPAFSRALAAVDHDVAVSSTGSLTGAYLGPTLAPRRFSVALLTGFGIIALVLAALGVYSVMAYSVEQRRRDIGLRIALGASPNQVVGVVLTNALRLAAMGVVLGIAGSVAAGKAVAGVLGGVSLHDPVLLGAVAAVLGGASILASWIPARRAATIDPIIVLSGDT